MPDDLGMHCESAFLIAAVTSYGTIATNPIGSRLAKGPATVVDVCRTGS